MNNFEFYNPVKIIFGKEQFNKLQNEISKDMNILFVYGGGSIKKNGVYDQIMTSLEGYNITEFSGIEANPQYETLMKAVTIAKEKKTGYILAVGGGSVIDGAKFISVAIHHPTEPWNILSQRESISGATPIGAVLTLPATGSEMNSFAVVSKGEEKLGFGGDPRLFPKFALLDPTTTYSLPEKQLGNGIVDAFVHVLEQYLTKEINTPIQDRFAEGILTTLINEAQKIIQIKDNYDSRANLMLSATYALNGMIGSGVVHDWSTHMIGHELTALHGLDHARSLAVILPSLLRSEQDVKKEKLIQFANNVWGLANTDYDKKIERAINMTEDFFNSVGVPTKLKAYNIQESDIDTIVESFVSHFPTSIGENQRINGVKVKEILHAAM